MEISKQHLQKKLIGPCVICGVEGTEFKFRRFTEDAKHKALQHKTLDTTWQLDITQFCHKHYMKYIVNGNIGGTLKKQRKLDDIAIMEIDHDGEPELIIDLNLKQKTSEVRDDKGVGEINFIENVKSMAQIFYAREKKEKELPIYDWKLLRIDMESKNPNLRPFFNMLEKLINPSSRGLVDQTVVQRQKGLSFLCYFLAGIGHKHISSLRKDIAMFLDHSGTSDRAIDSLSNMQLSSTSRENQREKNAISLIHRDNVTKELLKYQNNAIVVNIDDYHNIHSLRMPTTTSTSSVAHMTTILAIPIPTANAIPKNIIYNMNLNQYSIHNPLLIDSNSLIFQIENHHMALLSQSFNDRFIE